MPIITAAYQVLYEGRNAADAVRDLLTRSRKSEQEDAGWL
jgi:glycerol-3-phosphate dehydrogenase